jgi:hypothetical protein
MQLPILQSHHNPNAKLEPQNQINKICTVYIIFFAVNNERQCESAKQWKQWHQFG